MTKREKIIALLSEKILIIDGAMGTMIQRHHLEEEDYRGDGIFKNWHLDVKGNNDMLSITQPQIIQAIHKQYLDAGADIIETNTFNAQRVSLADYEMQDYADAINRAAVKAARAAVDEYKLEHPGEEKFVAGAIGPMNKTLSLSPDVNNPGFRAISYDQLVNAYSQQARALSRAVVIYF